MYIAFDQEVLKMEKTILFELHFNLKLRFKMTTDVHFSVKVIWKAVKMKNWTKLRNSSTSGHTKSIYSSFGSFSRLRNECLSLEN